jgi:plasmid stabilization system protein ParE
MIPMPPKPVEFDPRAVEEARAARRWYARRSQAVAERFLAELDRAVERIGSTPQIWPTYFHGTRVFRLRRFPYLISHDLSGERRGDPGHRHRPRPPKARVLKRRTT